MDWLLLSTSLLGGFVFVNLARAWGWWRLRSGAVLLQPDTPSNPWLAWCMWGGIMLVVVATMLYLVHDPTQALVNLSTVAALLAVGISVSFSVSALQFRERGIRCQGWLVRWDTIRGYRLEPDTLLVWPRNSWWLWAAGFCSWWPWTTVFWRGPLRLRVPSRYQAQVVQLLNERGISPVIARSQ